VSGSDRWPKSDASALGLAVLIVAAVAATILLVGSEGFVKPVYGVASLLLYAACLWGMAYVRVPASQ
jgi:hypothetical protein